jgi:hypothetical protein
VKQKTRKQAQEKQDFVVQEIEKRKKAKLIREVAHPTWIANPVGVPKANDSGRLCVDFTSLNPAKCAFSVPSGKLLGFLVSHHGIEANPEKVKAIEEMRPPHSLKEMQRLAGCMATLGRFIARNGEKALPFFKLMKRTRKF